MRQRSQAYTHTQCDFLNGIFLRMLNPLVTSMREGVLYRAKGNILWLAHRLSGLGIVLFLGFHIFGMSMSAFNPPLASRASRVAKRRKSTLRCSSGSGRLIATVRAKPAVPSI